MNVSVESLTITVAGGRQLLTDVSAVVQPGDMVALMGPSGAGKTTLLNSLVGRTILGSTDGGISYNGKSLARVRSNIGYVTQDDIMYETLTPRENLTFAAAFILAKLSRPQQKEVVEDVIKKLHLTKCADTVVGSPGLVRGISGGERKRTNVALSLIGKPALLLLDEPTSGLDSKMSDSLMRDVKSVAEGGCTVVATIHQPSEIVFARFDRVLLLAAGQIAYYGPIAGLRGNLQQLGFACPAGTPLPELLLDLLEMPAEGAQAHEAKLKGLRGLEGAAKAAGPFSPDGSQPQMPEARRASFCGQLGTLFRREVVNVKRNKALTVVRAVQSIASALLIGLIFVQLEKNMSGIQVRLFAGVLCIFTQFLFAILGVANAFPAERAVFLREAQDKLYHPAAFYLAKVFIDTILQSLFPLLTVAVAYPLIGLNGESADRLLWFYLIMAIVSNCGASMGFMVSAAVPSVSMVLSIVDGMLMPQMLLSGMFIKVDDLIQPFNALSYLMVVRYAVQAMVTNEFSCSEKADCDAAVWSVGNPDQCSESPCDFCCTAHEMLGSGGICPTLTCDDGLRFLGMDDIWPKGDSHSETILYNVVAMLILCFVFRLLGLNVLMMSYRKATTGSCLPCRFQKSAAVSSEVSV